MRDFLRTIGILLCFTGFVTLLSSCDDDKDSDLVPSYLSIEAFTVATDYEQGTASQKITDAWVYLDETLIGAFELPARVPILAEGIQNITVRPGIKLNGISNTRSIYPYLNPVTLKLRLTKDSVTALNSVATRYRDNVIFPWIENFELTASSLDTTRKSTVPLQITDNPALVFKFLNDIQPGTSSGMIQLVSDTSVFEAVTTEIYDFPPAGSEVFLEMNYKTENSLVVGVFYKSTGIEVQRPLIVLNKNDDWNKVYINLTVPRYDTPNAADFRIFFGAQTDAGNSQATILIDNIKLVYFNRTK